MVVTVTDKPLLRRRIARAHRAREERAAFLIDHVMADLAERLGATERQFATALIHGAQSDAPVRALLASGRIGKATRLDADATALAGTAFPALVGDEEVLPIAPGSLDLVISLLALHWANDLPGALTQMRQALRPDGLLLAGLLGGATLSELREALAEAESETSGGASPRVMPAVELREVGALLQRAGFALPVVDRDVLTVRYDSALALMRDLRAMGATNVSPERRRVPATRRLFIRAAEIYAQRFADADGRVRASFEVLSLSGWAPHESQQQAVRRGSASVSLARVLRPSPPKV